MDVAKARENYARGAVLLDPDCAKKLSEIDAGRVA
jgi:hypothetical protein